MEEEINNFALKPSWEQDCILLQCLWELCDNNPRLFNIEPYETGVFDIMIGHTTSDYHGKISDLWNENDWRGTTIIKIVRNISDLEQTVKNLNLIEESYHPSHLLFIFASRSLENIPTYLNILIGELACRIWTLDQIIHLIEMEREKIAFRFTLGWFYDKLFDWRTKRDALTQHNIAEVELKFTNMTRADKLKENYCDRNLVLFVGAGVSKNAGLPLWDELLSKLRIKLYERSSKTAYVDDYLRIQVCDSLSKKQEANPLIVSLELQEGLKDEFKNAISNVLYGDSLINEGKILREIVKICKLHYGKKRVQAVVTYNFDTLLEEEFERHNVNCTPVWEEGTTIPKESIPIYHVHGLLPRERRQRRIMRNLPLIFTEDKYHEVFQNQNHWVNYIQSRMLREHNSLFIGMSMTDPNLRRLLRICKQVSSRPRHYVYRKRLNPRELLELWDDKFEDQVKSIIRYHHRLEEQALNQLDVSAIWGQSYSGVVQLLQLIRGKNVSLEI